MEYQRKPQRPAPATRQASTHTPDPPALTQLEAQRQTLQRFTARPQTAQRQAAAPLLRAASLDRQEQDRLTGERTTVQRQIATLDKAAPAPPSAQPLPVPVKPTTPADWVTVMRERADNVQGQRLDPRAFGEFQTLQRQVAQTLAHSFRSDRGEAQARYAIYGEHLATLQRHALSAPVSRVVLGMVPPSERLPLQRATDEALQRQRAQEQAALNFGTLTSLQRQLAELDAEATQPVLQRIQARRGAGNPLPEAIQRHLEQGLNHDLSRVRIHDDAEADTLAKGVNATAFTTGTDIFFQSGQFNPNTQSGLELLAHEVTHTVQQSQGRVGTGIDPDAGLEQEARSVGKRLAAYTVMPGVQKRDMLSIASASAADRVQRQVNQQLRQANANRGAIAKVPQAAESDVYYQLREFNNGIPKDLTFDHGFLEGADGKLDASLMEKPTWADRKNRAFWVAKAQAALILRPDLFDSIAAYMHFLEASGRERDVGYERFLKNDPAGKVISKSLISSVQRGIGERIFFAEGLKEGEKYTSAGSTPIITTGSANQMYPYPATENWQKTLGSHPLWADASWTFVYSKAQYIKISATVEIRTRDMYNFNPGSKDIATGSPDAINGRFEVTGLGKEYINYGYAKRTVNFLFDKSKFLTKFVDQSKSPAFTPANPR